ncbi:MAG: DUF3524 domain-containing protein [Spirochaetes bacterium]|nr:DUF3524 domain-containing protein [Spirochaetota bacterium]MBN2772103.1 DUF3524 domain-containing protein [Spirochaetota bacterium]
MNKKKLHILAVEPLYTGSHRDWLDNLATHSRHRFDLITMPAGFWKWRIQGGALYLADQIKTDSYDLVLTTSMLNTSLFLSLNRHNDIAKTRTAVYFHENQLNYYPGNAKNQSAIKNDYSYAMISITNLIVADTVFFNSKYHHDIFFEQLPRFMSKLPDYNSLPFEELKSKCKILPVGIQTELCDSNLTEVVTSADQEINNDKIPVILWNHRRDADKNPDGFLSFLKIIDGKNLKFKLILLGAENKSDKVFNQIEQLFKDRIIFNGFASTRTEYTRLLKQAHFAPITSDHEYFGISVMEAAYNGVIPLLPSSLVYPTLYHPFNELFYTPHDYPALAELFIKLSKSDNHLLKKSLHNHASKYSWNFLIEKYDDYLFQASI